MGEGMVGAVTGSPATQIGMVFQNGSGQGMMSSFLANNATVNLTGSTAYYMDTDGMDMSNLPFTPVFDADHMYPGERVRCMSSNAIGKSELINPQADPKIAREHMKKLDKLSKEVAKQQHGVANALGISA